jgi:hypothetical protein
MPNSDRDQELIQKFLDAQASDADIAELEKRLVADPEFAAAFASAARLNASLERHFRKQYKIAQVATLLQSPEHNPAAPVSAFVPAPARLIKSRLERVASARQFTRPRGNPWRRGALAAALLLLAIGGAYWSMHRPESDRFRLLSGQVAVAGREVAAVSEEVLFEVAGPGAAVFGLPGNGRLELASKSQTLFRRDSDRIIVQVASGGGEFDLSAVRAHVRVETSLGTITTAGSRFSLAVVTAPPADFSPAEFSSTAFQSFPRLTVAVAEGSVLVEYHGVSTIVRAGETRVFPNPA